MLGRTLHVMNRGFTYLPNPTIFAWNGQSFSMRRMLTEFHTHIKKDLKRVEDDGQTPPSEIGQLDALASDLDTELPQTKTDFSPEHLMQLHRALDKTDQMLAANFIDKAVVLDVLRRHLQEVMQAINTPSEEQGRASPSMTQPGVSFDDLLNVPPENREREFMRIYFDEIRLLVISTTDTNQHDLQAANASRKIHKNSFQQQKQTRDQQREGQIPPGTTQAANQADGTTDTSQSQPQPPSQPEPQSQNELPGIGLRGRVGTLASLYRSNTMENTVFEVRRNNVWCTLVFRMVCWLLLHDFDKNDVQIDKGELMGSRLPVYIM